MSSLKHKQKGVLFKPLEAEEILILANQRAKALQRQHRRVVLSQHQQLIKLLEGEVVSKKIKVKDFIDED